MDDADDLVQAAYERALNRLDQWQPGTRLDSWMFRIIQSLQINKYHADKVRKRYLDDNRQEMARSHDDSVRLEALSTLEKVRQYIWELPDKQREILLLTTVEGLSYKEAANVLDVPIGTVTSRLARARVTISERLEADDRPG